MRTKIFTAALLSTLILTSCDNDNQDTIKPSKYITVSAEMGALTRVAGTDFEQDDQISIYAWTGDPETVSSELVVNNSINTFDGTSIQIGRAHV